MGSTSTQTHPQLPVSDFDYEWPKVPPNHVGSGGSVRAALDTIVATLTAHPEYRFVWSETIWFDKWWQLQNGTTQASFRRIVDNGQFEFVGGGYVQGDEATTTFADVIDQTTTGHEVLRTLLPGSAPPRHGWQVSGGEGGQQGLNMPHALIERFETTFAMDGYSTHTS